MGFASRFMRSNSHITNADTPRVSGSSISSGARTQPERSQTAQQQSVDAVTNLSALKQPLNLSLKNPALNREKGNLGGQRGGFYSVGKK